MKLLTVNYYTSDRNDYYTYLKIAIWGFFISLFVWIGLLIAAIKIKPKDDNSNADEIKSTKTKLWIWFGFFLIIFFGFVYALNTLNWGFRY